jgi:pimeloyl-ACP methyl ester carboxylesterase
VVPRAGHLVPIEQPEAVARLLADWIASSNETEQRLSGRAS